MKLTALQKFLELDNIIKFLKTNIFKLFIIFSENKYIFILTWFEEDTKKQKT